MADIFRDPHFQARENLILVEHPIVGRVAMPGIVPKLSATPGTVRFPGPASIGEHNREVFEGLLALRREDMDELRSAVEQDSRSPVDPPFPQHARHGLGQRGRCDAGGSDPLRWRLGGMGGCPYAPGATGNVATEDLTHMLTAMSVKTRVDLDALLAVARGLQEIAQRLESSMVRAWKWKELAPGPMVQEKIG